MLQLNLGCGKDIRAGYVNVDKAFLKGVDVVCDLEQGLPFKASVFEGIFSRYVLEHIQDLIQCMSEIHRILKPDGMAHIEVPHCTCVYAYTDPSHKIFFTLRTMDFFEEGASEGYFLNIPFRFKIVSKRLRFTEDRRLRILNFIINSMVNRFPDIYERFFMWRLPMNKIIFEMKAIKEM